MPPKIRPCGRKRIIVKVKCDCGSIKNVYYEAITAKNNPTYSCGCYHKSILKEGRSRKYKYSKHPLYKVWVKIKERCYSSSCREYKYYGARGIKICNEWLNDFDKFYEWSINNGYKKGLQIDRIDNDRGYSSDNCRYITRRVNCNNKTNNVIIDYNGVSDTLANTMRRLGIFEHYKKVHRRMNQLKWPFEKSIQKL